MADVSNYKNANLGKRFRNFFTTRDFIFHDGRDLRRFSVAGRTQALFAGVAAVTVLFSGYGVSQAMAGAIAVSGVSAAARLARSAGCQDARASREDAG
jgi:hypothetical protein